MHLMNSINNYSLFPIELFPFVRLIRLDYRLEPLVLVCFVMLSTAVLLDVRPDRNTRRLSPFSPNQYSNARKHKQNNWNGNSNTNFNGC